MADKKGLLQKRVQISRTVLQGRWILPSEIVAKIRRKDVTCWLEDLAAWRNLDWVSSNFPGWSSLSHTPWTENTANRVLRNEGRSGEQPWVVVWEVHQRWTRRAVEHQLGSHPNWVTRFSHEWEWQALPRCGRDRAERAQAWEETSWGLNPFQAAWLWSSYIIF